MNFFVELRASREDGRSAGNSTVRVTDRDAHTAVDLWVHGSLFIFWCAELWVKISSNLQHSHCLEPVSEHVYMKLVGLQKRVNWTEAALRGSFNLLISKITSSLIHDLRLISSCVIGCVVVTVSLYLIENITINQNVKVALTVSR